MKKFLIAKSLRHAVIDAQIDKGWKLVKRYQAIDEAGDTVELVGAEEIGRKLRGHKLVGIYWGYRGESSVDHYDYQIIKFMENDGKLVILECPNKKENSDVQ